MLQNTPKTGSHNNIWYGQGRQRIEIPKPVLKSRILNNQWLKQLYLYSLGYYPQAEGHYTYRKKGLPENFLFFCVDGTGWYKIEDKQYEVGPNDFFILPQNKEHSYGSHGNGKKPWSIYWIHFGGELLPHFNSLLTVQEHYKPCYIKNGEAIIAQFTKMYKALELGYSIDNLLFANMCLSHYLTLFIYDSRHRIISIKEKTDCVDNAILYMREHVHENISLPDLSKTYGYSTSRFSDIFKQKTGYSPIDYFIQMKMQKACQQLDLTDTTIKEVAMQLGFEDPYYFSRRFSKVIGMPPTKYRSVRKD